MGPSQVIEEIMRYFDNNDPIPKTSINEWSSSEDIEVLGVLCNLILDSRCYKRINPPLTIEEYQQIILNFYGRCILENPQGEWSEPRYIAGYELMRWFMGLWNDKNVPRKEILKIKNWLAEMYKQSDKGVKNCIVVSVLEHLFEDKKVRRFFADWQRDPILKEAYSEAMEWAR